jgi:DNA-binding transcriptional MerR regulator
MASHHPIRKIVTPEPVAIPDKLYFRIGDVAKLCGVPAYVLRFWETEFPQLKPNKGGTGQRLYRKKDVEMALRIKSLLYDQGYTIPGARQAFKTDAKAEPQSVDPTPEAVTPSSIEGPALDLGAQIRQEAQHRMQLTALRDELRSLAGLLGSPAGPDHPAQPLPAPKVKPMRPRLVLEPKPEPRSLLNQGDLFSTE